MYYISESCHTWEDAGEPYIPVPIVECQAKTTGLEEMIQ